MASLSQSYFKKLLVANAKQPPFIAHSKSKVHIYTTTSQTASASSPLPLQIIYDICSSPYGACFLALSSLKLAANKPTTAQNIAVVCKLAFPAALNATRKPSQQKINTLVYELQQAWPQAKLSPANENEKRRTRQLLRNLFAIRAALSDTPTWHVLAPHRATALQLQVWRALTRLQAASVVSYSQLAAYVQAPKAVRAVASAVARNPIAYLIPCHRVIKKDGQPHAYRWDAARKFSMLTHEALT